MITFTKDVVDEFDKNALYQFQTIHEIYLKPECDKHNFRIGNRRLLKNHYNFQEERLLISEGITVQNLNILKILLNKIVIQI